MQGGRPSPHFVLRTAARPRTVHHNEHREGIAIAIMTGIVVSVVMGTAAGAAAPTTPTAAAPAASAAGAGDLAPVALWSGRNCNDWLPALAASCQHV